MASLDNARGLATDDKTRTRLDRVKTLVAATPVGQRLPESGLIVSERELGGRDAETFSTQRARRLGLSARAGTPMVAHDADLQ